MTEDLFTPKVRVINKTSNVISISPAAVLAGNCSDLLKREEVTRNYCETFAFALDRCQEDWEWRLRYGF